MSDPISAPSTVLPPVEAPLAPVAGHLQEKILKVGGGTDCKRLACAIVGVIEKELKQPIVEFIGASACAQAVKAVAIANTMLARTGTYISAVPVFVRRDLADNHDATGLQLRVIIHKMS